nr:ATP-binding cassette domain-containing protein [Corynebacterium auriscanis]
MELPHLRGTGRGLGTICHSRRPRSIVRAQTHEHSPQHRHSHPLKCFPQHSHSQPLTVRSPLHFRRQMAGPAHTDRSRCYRAALEIAHLTDLRDRQIGQLSGGQKKRVFVARGIAQGAHTLLLDEPFAGVDNTSRDDLTALFRQLAAEGKALLVATHDIDHLPTFCDEVVMINGRVIADGPTAATLTDENLLRAFSGVRGGVEGGKQ